MKRGDYHRTETRKRVLVRMSVISPAMGWCLANRNWTFASRLYTDLRAFAPDLKDRELMGTPWTSSARQIKHAWVAVTPEYAARQIERVRQEDRKQSKLYGIDEKNQTDMYAGDEPDPVAAPAHRPPVSDQEYTSAILAVVAVKHAIKRAVDDAGR